MGFFSNILENNLANDPSQRLINTIKEEAALLQTNTEEELQEKIQAVKRYAEKEGIDSILAKWFALTQEVSYRTIGLRHFDTQLLAGIALHQGKVVEMKTGEGKTLAATLAVSLNALTKKGVHVVTVNEYLAERDQQSMGRLYKGLGLTTGLILNSHRKSTKQKEYNADITYVTNSQVVFDFLQDCSSYDKNELVQRPFNYCVVDEIDSILIDESRTPLIISEMTGAIDTMKLSKANQITLLLKIGVDFTVDEKRRDVNLTDRGYEVARRILGKQDLFEENDAYILEIINALKANVIFKKNKDYMVAEDKVVIIDEISGRVMADRRWGQGIHEAIETKEKVTMGDMTRTKTSMTYQNFFTLYPKLSGMSGTALTTAKEFKQIYKLDVKVIPTAKPMIREDFPDLIYQTDTVKWKAVLRQAKECFNKGQPILIGTGSVETSELISDLLSADGIPHELLNAKPENVTRESEIIALAGQPYGVTIATNMAGRGTDIILGGNPNFTVKNRLQELLLDYHQGEVAAESLEILNFVESVYNEYKEKKTLKDLDTELENLPYSLEKSLPSLQSLYNCVYKNEVKKWETKNEKVRELGGLYVLGTERAETRRIDDQLRGRAGRQGDPGVSQFYVSLEDKLMKLFAKGNISNLVNVLLEDKDTPLQGKLLSQSLENAQKRVETLNFESRKNIFEYDDILNDQRKSFFGMRRDLLIQYNSETDILQLTESFLDKFLILSNTTKRKVNANDEKIYYEIEDWLGSYFNLIDKDENYFTFRMINEQNEKSYKNLEKLLQKTAETSNSAQDEMILKTNIFGTKKDVTEENVLNLRNILEKKDVVLALERGFYQELWISTDLRYGQTDNYDAKLLNQISGAQILNIIDLTWTEHLERLNFIRETINWRSYGQQIPLTEYNLEAAKSYRLMYSQIQVYMLYYFLRNPLIN